MHLPVEVGISGRISYDLPVELVDSGFTCSVSIDCGIDIGDKSVEIFLVFALHILVLAIVLLEPGDNLGFIVIESEGMVLHILPLFGVLSSEGYIITCGKCELVQSKHGDDVIGDWIELISQEGLDFWDDVVDMGAVEVGVGDHVGDDLLMSAHVDLLPGLNQGSEHDPIVLIESLYLELKVLKRSLPVAHQEIILCFQPLRPAMNQVLVHNKEEVRINTVLAFRFIIRHANINVLDSDCFFNSNPIIVGSSCS